MGQAGEQKNSFHQKFRECALVFPSSYDSNQNFH